MSVLAPDTVIEGRSYILWIKDGDVETGPDSVYAFVNRGNPVCMTDRAYSFSEIVTWAYQNNLSDSSAAGSNGSAAGSGGSAAGSDGSAEGTDGSAAGSDGSAEGSFASTTGCSTSTGCPAAATGSSC